MQTVAIYQLKNELSRYIDLVVSGEEVAITRRGQEIARLVPSSPKSAIDRVAEIRRIREAFAAVPVFDEREVTAVGRKW